jgi:hypothetical protein
MPRDGDDVSHPDISLRPRFGQTSSGRAVLPLLD